MTEQANKDSPLDSEMERLFKYLELSLSLTKQDIDVSEEIRKILKKEIEKELQKSLKDMMENGDFTQLLEDAGIFKTDETSQQQSGSSGNENNNIDQMVAAALLSGFQTTSVLKNLFGLTPNLIGR